MDRNYLAGRKGDAANAVLAAVGYNFRLLLAWLSAFLSLLLAAPLHGRDLHVRSAAGPDPMQVV